MADVAEHPAFAADELERSRKEDLDDLVQAYRRPGAIAELLTHPVVLAGTPLGHAADGDAASLRAIGRDDLVDLHRRYWRPDNATLVIAGNLAPARAFALADQAFGAWRRPSTPRPPRPHVAARAPTRAVAVDLPAADQASVVIAGVGVARTDRRYYRALVANAVLGGGFSSRLDEEVRIKRGLSYGAGSSLTALIDTGFFVAEAQTKNETAPQVVGLMRDEIARLGADPVAPGELAARKSALIGEYGRALGTAEGLAAELGALAVAGAPLSDLSAYPANVEAVSPEQARAAAHDVLASSTMSLVVVGDAKVFVAPLEAQNPNLEVIPIARLDPDSPNLEKP